MSPRTKKRYSATIDIMRHCGIKVMDMKLAINHMTIRGN